MARKTSQFLALLAFLALFLATRHGAWPAFLVNFPLRLDPLVILANLLSSRTWLAGSGLALALLGLSLVFGRAWCGWLCPLGTLLDWISPARGRNTPRPAPAEAWRGVKYFLLLAILVTAFLGNLTLLILDPLTILVRTLTISVWPALDQAVSALEMTFYRVPALQTAIAGMDSRLRPAFLPVSPVTYRDALLFAGIFAGIVALNWVAPRFWCRYLCPLGGLLGMIAKISLFRRRVKPECKGCKLCNRACPTGTIDPDQGYASDPGECTLCLDCLDACPRGTLTFSPGLSIAAWNRYDPNRRQALAALGFGAAALGLFHSGVPARREASHWVRPPGARENDFLQKCIRCGICLRACPTNGLQAAQTEAGLEGLWTPVLVPRLGYCDYTCNACGQTCPVQAIPPLPLEEKRLQVIGKAYLDPDRCIAWSDHQPCIVCEEMCPLPEKAVQLQENPIIGPEGEMLTLQMPYVVRERCIGCGICEYKCPVNGGAAIRVYVV